MLPRLMQGNAREMDIILAQCDKTIQWWPMNSYLSAMHKLFRDLANRTCWSRKVQNRNTEGLLFTSLYWMYWLRNKGFNALLKQKSWTRKKIASENTFVRFALYFICFASVSCETNAQAKFAGHNEIRLSDQNIDLILFGIGIRFAFFNLSFVD